MGEFAHIAEEAGVSNGLLYQFFESKGHLLQVVLEEVIRDWVRAMVPREEPGERTASQALEGMFRRSVAFCRSNPLLPALLEEHQLTSKPAGTRRAPNEELEELGLVVFCSDRKDAAAAMAEALAGGLSHRDAGEALTLAANHLLLHDPGREQDQPGKPRGRRSCKPIPPNSSSTKTSPKASARTAPSACARRQKTSQRSSSS